MTDASIDKVFATIDSDGKGTITQGELTSAVNKRPSTAERERRPSKEGAALKKGESSQSGGEGSPPKVTRQKSKLTAG